MGCTVLVSRAATEASAVAAHTGLRCVGAERGTPASLTPIASSFSFSEPWVRLLGSSWLRVGRFLAGHLHQGCQAFGGSRSLCEFL